MELTINDIKLIAQYFAPENPKPSMEPIYRNEWVIPKIFTSDSNPLGGCASAPGFVAGHPSHEVVPVVIGRRQSDEEVW